MMKLHKLILGITMMIGALTAKAQQDPNFNLYRFNMNIINPAYAGANGNTEIQLTHKDQWVGLEGAPTTQTLIFQMPMSYNLGVGISMSHDDIFVLDQTNIGVDISYKLALTSEYDLFFGIKPGVSFTNIDLTNIGVDGQIDALFNKSENYASPLFGAGFYLKHKDWFATVSSPNFVNGDRFVRDKGSPTAVENKPHYYVGAGYHILVNDNLKLTPEFLTRTVIGAPVAINFAFDVYMYNKINAGINHRIDENIGFYGLFNVNNKINLGFGYDFTLSKVSLNNRNNYSVEFLLKYIFI